MNGWLTCTCRFLRRGTLTLRPSQQFLDKYGETINNFSNDVTFNKEKETKGTHPGGGHVPSMLLSLNFLHFPSQ